MISTQIISFVRSKYATATGLSDLLSGSISHDKITRFLNGRDLNSKDLWEFIKPEVRKHEENSGGVLILDDSIEEKPYTDENEIMCWHYSHFQRYSCKRSKYYLMSGSLCRHNISCRL